MKIECPTLGILVKFFERPFIYWLSANFPAFFFKKAELRRLARTYVAIDDDTEGSSAHLVFKSSILLGQGRVYPTLGYTSLFPDGPLLAAVLLIQQFWESVAVTNNLQFELAVQYSAHLFGSDVG